jgi:hypothetical protein
MATVADFISILRNSSPQVHIFHNQTRIYSEHQALGMYYDDVLDLIDRLTETYTALNGEIINYTSMPYRDYVSKDETVNYFKALYQYVETNRVIFKQSFLQNIIDELCELLTQTLFRLGLDQI